VKILNIGNGYNLRGLWDRNWELEWKIKALQDFILIKGLKRDLLTYRAFTKTISTIR